jgi:hypothetical protein
MGSLTVFPAQSRKAFLSENPRFDFIPSQEMPLPEGAGFPDGNLQSLWDGLFAPDALQSLQRDPMESDLDSRAASTPESPSPDFIAMMASPPPVPGAPEWNSITAAQRQPSRRRPGHAARASPGALQGLYMSRPESGRRRSPSSESSASDGSRACSSPLGSSQRISKPREHRLVERKYRSTICARITELRDCIPSLQRAADSPSPGESNDGEFEQESATKLTKAMILAAAVQYIREIQRRNAEIQGERDEWKERCQMFERLILRA